MTSRNIVRTFLVVAAAEAVSWAGLLIGMYFKYVADAGELGVKIFGPIHGAIFIGYVLLTLALARKLRWPHTTTLVALACSIPPFFTLAFEVWAQRTGRLTVPESAEQPVPVAG